MKLNNLLEKYNKVKGKISVNETNVLPYILDITMFCQKQGWNITPFPKVNVDTTTEFTGDIIGKTGWFDPETNEITMITAGRHPIDVCKTYIHELKHYDQKNEGRLTEELINKTADPRYMEKSDELMKLEEEAYLQSGLIFRMWRDQFK